MPPFLTYICGDEEKIRGRAIIYVEKIVDGKSSYHFRRVEVNGASLRETIRGEIIEGRLVSMEVFDAFYTRTTSLESRESLSHLLEAAKKESRDLVSCSCAVSADDMEQKLEEALNSYVSSYRENIYLRTLRQTKEDLFNYKLRVKNQIYYMYVFELAQYVCLYTRSMRDENTVDQKFYLDSISELVQSKLPLLNQKRILIALEKGTNRDWLEVADYIDALFLTLKKHYPVPLYENDCFCVNDSGVSWLKNGISALYEKLFVALLNENYEKALEIQDIMSNWDASESVTGCSN